MYNTYVYALVDIERTMEEISSVHCMKCKIIAIEKSNDSIYFYVAIFEILDFLTIKLPKTAIIIAENKKSNFVL